MTGETRRIEANGVEFRVRLDGTFGAPPILFSNSLGSNLEMWDPQLKAFEKTHRILRYDVRGHGQSSSPGGLCTIATLASDALRILDALGVYKTDWVGCSMGGMVGQWLLTHHRDRIGKAVLGNTAAFMGPPFTDWNARIRMANAKGMAPIADAMKSRWFTKRFNESHPDVVAAVCGANMQVRPETYTGICGAIRDMDQRESIKSIANEVLVVIGADDPATPPAAGHLMARNIPGAKTLVLDAAHISNVEAADAYNNGVAAFLNG